MLNEVISTLKSAAGVEDVADLGVLFNGKYGRNDCAVLARIETFKEFFFVCIEVRLTRGAAFQNTKVVKWPYSRTNAQDLGNSLHDLRRVAGSLENFCLEDRRGVLGRLFDRMTGRKYLGVYTFMSPLEEERPRTVEATVIERKEGPCVTLMEKRKSSEGIYASLPLAAISKVIDGLEAWRQRPPG